MTHPRLATRTHFRRSGRGIWRSGSRDISTATESSNAWTYGCVIKEEESTGLIREVGNRRGGLLGSNGKESGEDVEEP